MSNVGISCYPGLVKDQEATKASLEIAFEYGARHVFISLHIPETDFDQVFVEAEAVCAKARELGMSVMADISPRTLSYLGIDKLDPRPFADLGLTDLRLDYGFTLDDVLSFIAESHGLGIVINASDVTNRWIEVLKGSALAETRLWACHNFYPRVDTGLSWEYVVERSELLKSAGMEVAAFVPSRTSKRPIMYEGLPTVERHRWMAPGSAARELFSSGVIDRVYFGDPNPSRDELQEVVRASQEKCLEVRVIAARPLSEVETALAFGRIHTQRRRQGYAHVIRSGVQGIGKDRLDVYPAGDYARPRGTVTIDNINYGRYCGELQITLRDLDRDPRVNVIGKVVPEDEYLLDLIRSGADFRLKLVDRQR